MPSLNLTLDEAISYLNEYPDAINQQDEDGNTALHNLVMQCGSLKHQEARHLLAEFLKQIKTLAIDHTLLNRDGHTALHLAAIIVHPGMTVGESYLPDYATPVELLLSTFEDPGINLLSTDGATALAYALKKGKATDVQALLQAGASTTLHQNPAYDSLTLLADFIEHIELGVFVTKATDEASSRCLKQVSGMLEAMQISLQRAKPIQRHFKALLKQPVHHLRKLASMDPSIFNAQDEEGMTLYHHLARITSTSKLNMPIVDFLFSQSGVNLSLQDYCGNTAIHTVLERFSAGFMSTWITLPLFCQMMRRCGFDYSTVNHNGDSVYHLAAVSRYTIDNTSAFVLLVQDMPYHPAINLVNKDGETALTLVCDDKNRAVPDKSLLWALIHHGAAPKKNSSQTVDPKIFIQIQIDDNTQRREQAEILLASPDLLGVSYIPNPPYEFAQREEEYRTMLLKMQTYHLQMLSLASREISMIAAILSQGIRPGHDFYKFPKDILTRFTIFATRAPVWDYHSAETSASSSLTRWLEVKTKK